MRLFYTMLIAALMAAATVPATAGTLRIAAAADLKFAMAELVEMFRAEQPGEGIEVIYGSSGKFFTQIVNGAPFDMYFSADIAYPRKLEQRGHPAGATRPYAFGRIVPWSLDPALAQTPLKGLPDAAIRKFSIANPQHAPYGLRAKEALEHEGAGRPYSRSWCRARTSPTQRSSWAVAQPKSSR